MRMTKKRRGVKEMSSSREREGRRSPERRGERRPPHVERVEEKAVCALEKKLLVADNRKERDKPECNPSPPSLKGDHSSGLITQNKEALGGKKRGGNRGGDSRRGGWERRSPLFAKDVNFSGR